VTTIIDAIKYWLRATWRPRDVVLELKNHPKKVAIAVWVNITFAVLYAGTAFIYYSGLVLDRIS
jgi:hypothetical protein